MKTRNWGALTLALLTGLSTGVAMADDGAATADGKPVLRSMSHDASTVGTHPVPEADHAFIARMKFPVTAQKADGTTTTVEYFNADGALVSTAGFAKPLIGVYHYGPVVEVDGVGFIGHGKRDAYASVSLDDGLTWKNTNLSESASETSCKETTGSGGCTVVRTDVPLFADTDFAYPGDVVNVFHSIAGNKVLVAWPSRYCSSGQPNYSLDTAEPSPEQAARRAAIAAYLGINLDVASRDDLYLVDMFGVGGQQGFVDYVEDKWEQNWAVGQVPFNCLWTARGVLVQGDDPRTATTIESSYMRWFKAERLTSGRRDVNRIETVCVAGAGCAITWQEDPEGLRPGQGEGPGEGWSGAIANSQTDVWYSYIPWAHFDVVQNPTDETGATSMTFAEYEAAAIGDITQKPKPFVPFAMPMRMTDNAKCNVTNPTPYCNGSAIAANFPTIRNPLAYGLKDMCKAVIQIPTGKEGTLSDVCVTEGGLPLIGNTAATRPRLGLYGYASSGNVADPADSAFAVVVAEEDKGLGKFTFLDGTTVPCEPTEDEGCNAFDEGKNIRYFSFSMSLTDSLASTRDGLVANLVNPGGLLNQPEVNWQTGNFYPVVNTAALWDYGTYNHDIYNTEIARRGSLLAQDIYKVTGNTTKAKERLIALPTWKQGTMNQGGPADVMSRRILVPKNWKLSKDGNPYAFRNLACSNWAYKTGNAYYPEGVCLDPAINLSATIPDTCQDSETGGLVNCPQVDFAQNTPFGIGDTNPVLQGFVQGEGNTTKVLSWHQCQTTQDTYTTATGQVVSCANDERADTGANKTGNAMLDQSWYNPLDVSKGHRGLLDGDFVMMLYAWSPNWRLNAKGNDRYELYIRRSFDGGLTWTTLPKNYAHWDGTKHTGAGTVTCETFRSEETQASGDLVEPGVCNTYLAGGNEQARNVTQHKSMRITLDPRYAISGSPQGVSNTTDPFGTGFTTLDDVRDPSVYFIVYETGDNTTTAVGEPEPEDLFYSRAVLFGDHYQVWAERTDLSQCYPSNPHENEVPAHVIGSGFCNEFDQMEQGTPGLSASEASLAASPSGQFLYGVWAQWAHDELTGEISESDAMARRVWWLEGYIPTTAWDFGQGTGDGTPAN